MKKKIEDSGDLQKPQDPIDQHGPKYDNDVPADSWLRSEGEKKPAFDKHRGSR